MGKEMWTEELLTLDCDCLVLLMLSSDFSFVSKAYI